MKRSTIDLAPRRHIIMLVLQWAWCLFSDLAFLQQKASETLLVIGGERGGLSCLEVVLKKKLQRCVQFDTLHDLNTHAHTSREVKRKSLVNKRTSQCIKTTHFVTLLESITCKAADSSGNVYRYISLRLSSYPVLNPYPDALEPKNQEEFWSCFWITVKLLENRSLRKCGCFCVFVWAGVHVWIGKQARLGCLLWVSCIVPPWTCTGLASCWPSWCSLTNPWRFCGWSGRSSPPVSSAFEYQMAKAGPQNCQGIWLERLPTQHAMFFSASCPSPPPPLSRFHPLVRHER